jgi:hypothetical protein
MGGEKRVVPDQIQQSKRLFGPVIFLALIGAAVGFLCAQVAPVDPLNRRYRLQAAVESAERALLLVPIGCIVGAIIGLYVERWLGPYLTVPRAVVYLIIALLMLIVAVGIK